MVENQNFRPKTEFSALFRIKIKIKITKSFLCHNLYLKETSLYRLLDNITSAGITRL